jgi:putative transcriptional regulator
MVNVLHSKRDGSRFQILADTGAHQPNLRQKEVAERLGVTTQDISDYVRKLGTDGLATTDGRARYGVTKEGVEWLLEGAAELKQYARMVMEGAIEHVSVWMALAEVDLGEGERVSLEMRGGLLYANKKEGIDASGITISAASAGEDVGVSDIKGLISLEAGTIVESATRSGRRVSKDQ